MKIIFSIIFFIFTTNVFAVDPTLNWKTVETKNFYIHFSEDSFDLAVKASKAAENAHKKLSPVINWQPKEKTHLVISDETGQPNGYAIPFPFNRSVLFVAPPDTTNSLEDFDSWLDILIIHEYTHILHLDKVAGGASSLRDILGRHYLLFPNSFQPAWFIEGLATYYETDLEKGVGRGQSSFFQMMMRMDVASGVKPVSQANLPIRSWPMGTTYYLYGVHFFQFIEDRYGKEVISELVDNYSSNIIPFMINTNAKNTLGKNINQLWDEFILWLNERYLPQLDEIEQQGVIEGKRITENGYFTGPVKVLADERVFYIREGAFDYPALISIDENGIHDEIAEVHPGARMDVHAEQGVLIAQLEYCDEHNSYYDLFIVKPDDDNAEAITSCGRYRSAAWSADGKQIIAVHTDKSISQLHILNNKGQQQSIIWKGKDNEVIGQPDWSPDGRFIVASIFRPGKGWNIEQYDLNTKQWEMITNDEFIDVQPQYSADGSSIVFSSDRTGIYNIYQYHLYYQNISQLTRVKSGAFRPSMSSENGSLFYMNYSNNGTDVFVLNDIESFDTDTTLELHKIIEEGNEPRDISLSEINDYSPWSSMKLHWWEPVLFFDEEKTEIGFSSSGNDALDIHNYFVQAAYDAKNEWFVGDVSYMYSNNFIAGIQRSTDIISDINGDFSYAIKSDDAFITLALPYTKYDFNWNLYTGVFVRNDSVGRRSENQLSLVDFKDNLVGLAVTFGNAKNYIRSISMNDGRVVKVIAESNNIIESDFSGEIYTLDWREFIPLGSQHVLALRLTQGHGKDNPKPFKLGGEDDSIDVLNIINPTGEPIFGHRKYSLRGYQEGLPQLSGRNFQLASLEWRFPISLIERGLMSPPVGVNQFSGSIFVDSGATWQEGNSPDEYFTGVGMELHTDAVLFYGLNLKMRLGLASGLDEDIGTNRFYLSLGASF